MEVASCNALFTLFILFAIFTLFTMFTLFMLFKLLYTDLGEECMYAYKHI